MLLRKMERRFGESRSRSLLVWSVMVVVVVCRDDEMQSTKDKKGKAAGHFVDIVRWKVDDSVDLVCVCMHGLLRRRVAEKKKLS